MAQQGKVLGAQAWQPEFEPQNPYKGGRREIVPQINL